MEKGFAVSEICKDFDCGEEKRRDCFWAVKKYLTDHSDYSKICAIYGLRGTGKTTLLKQAAAELSSEEQKKALYIKCFEGADFYELVQYMEDWIEKGYRYFFIDEVTYADGFERIGTILPDIFAGINQAKIIVTGTDSLELLLASKDKMYDRIEFVNTTYTSFPEYARLTGITSMDEYIRKGSTLHTDVFCSKKRTDDFIETAIVKNIVRSLQRYEGVNRYPSVLTEKYSEEAIRREIEILINRYSQECICRAMMSQLKSVPTGVAGDMVLQGAEDGREIVADLRCVNQKIAEISGCDKPSGIEDRDISKLYNYLQEIGVFERIPVYNSYSGKVSDEPFEMLVHPGMLHANICYTLAELQKDCSWINAPETDKKHLLKKTCESVMGKMMENVIISDIYHLLCLDHGHKPDAENVKEDLFGAGIRWYVSKLHAKIKGEKHKADVLIFDKEKKESYLFAIKYSSESVKEQSQHLENKDFLNDIEANFGKIKGRAVLYNGAGDYNFTIPRISAGSFMMQLYHDYGNVDFTIDQTLQNIIARLHNK